MSDLGARSCPAPPAGARALSLGVRGRQHPVLGAGPEPSPGGPWLRLLCSLQRKGRRMPGKLSSVLNRVSVLSLLYLVHSYLQSCPPGAWLLAALSCRTFL